MDDVNPVKKPLHYYSTIRGVESTDGDLVYVGLVFRYPIDEIMGDSEMLHQEVEAEQAAINRYLANLPGDSEVSEVFERYEVRDIDANEIVVMWRIPTRTKGSRKKVAQTISPHRQRIH